ncbi:MAG: hypothetical protein K2M27_01825 [Muribaculaceae bacterium]|nr:hypothetical protein [Muribaculaceae bacterium]
MSKSRIISFILLAFSSAIPTLAQEASWFKRNHVIDDLDVAFTAGTSGLGIELSTPVTKWTNVRVGFDGMPQFHLPIDFPISTYADGKVSDNFDKIKEMMYKITGDEMKEQVEMIGKPRMANFKFLVDVYPFQNNRHWHFTAGFYWGTSKIATALNNVESSSTLVAMNIYNRFYDRMKDYPYTDEPFFGDVYLSEETYNEFMSYGRMGIHLGDFKDGKPYYMDPASNGTLSAKAFVNAFKPYLGFGYSGAIDAAKRWNVGVEAGVLFWGGAPQIILHDGVNMTKDLINVKGKVGDFLNLAKALPVFPSISFKISYSIF